MSSSGSLQVTFLAALQASLAVLLTISYGFLASRFRLLSEKSSEDISKLCVKLFLPALLITNVGSQLHIGSLMRYVPILLWSLIYNLLSLLLGWSFTRMFKLPAWTTPAVMFNNTTSLPLLLIQSLDTTGILRNLIMSDDEPTSEAVKRAKSYFLACAVVGNSLTFALGPTLLMENTESKKQMPGNHVEGTHEETQDLEHAGAHEHTQSQEDADENTSLLPDNVVHFIDEARQEITETENKYWKILPHPLQTLLHFSATFLNPVVIGAVIGAVVGLVPPMHKAFFNTPGDGGFFKAWLTASIENVGDMFAALQLFVVGSKLTHCFVRMKKGEDSGYVPWNAMAVVFTTRFVIWPLLSIGTIYMLASRTNLLGNDPMLWFCLMLMPTGPPALKLTALADVTGAPESEKLAIAKFLMIAYTISPLICFSVVGSLKASEVVIAQ